MRPEIVALAAAVLIAGAATGHTQEPGTTQDAGTAAAQPGGAPDKPAVGAQEPKLTPKLLIDTFNALTRPRPRPPAEPAAAPSAATPLPAEPATVAAAPAPSIAATPGAVVPPGVKSQPSPAVPRAEAVAAPRPVRQDATPAPIDPIVEAAEPASTAQPEPAVAELPPPAAVASEPAAQAPLAAAEPAAPVLGATTLLLVGLLVAAVVAAAAIGLQHARRIARTRAVLTLNPRLDPSVGATTLAGLALAGPRVAIRARLDGAP